MFPARGKDAEWPLLTEGGYVAENRFEERYRSGDTPWDHGRVDDNLIAVVSGHGISRCRALDIGCGSGENAIWLAQQGFEVDACDISPTAIRQGAGKLSAAGPQVHFLVADFLADPIPDAPFGFVFDRGCLHSMEDDTDRKRFAEKVFGLLEEGGQWLSLVGNADEGEREIGPPQLTASELVAVVEPFFEILSLHSGHFGSDQAIPPRAWICMMRKRAD
jgi:SAM-dependent methyltransferase